MSERVAQKATSRPSSRPADRCPNCGRGLDDASAPRAAGRSQGSSPQGSSTFSSFARTIARWTGRPATFTAAVLLVVIWLVTGPLFHYSDTWQLIINTSTTIITFWMVFVIQHTQTRDTDAMQIKLDEIIRATQGAHNALMGLEDADEGELEAYRERFAVAAAAARAALERGVPDTGAGDEDTAEEGERNAGRQRRER